MGTYFVVVVRVIFFRRVNGLLNRVPNTYGGRVELDAAEYVLDWLVNFFSSQKIREIESEKR